MPTCLYESAPSSLGRYRRQGRGGLQAERHGRPPDGKPLNAAAGPNAADFTNSIRWFARRSGAWQKIPRYTSRASCGNRASLSLAGRKANMEPISAIAMSLALGASAIAGKEVV